MKFFAKKAKQADMDRLELAFIEILAAVKNIDMRLREVVEMSDRHADAIDGLGALMGKDWDDAGNKWIRRRKKNGAVISDNRSRMVGADCKAP